MVPEEYKTWVHNHKAEEIGSVLIYPQDLISPYRFDLMAKYLYAYYRKHAIRSFWALDVYAEHLRIWNNFFEHTPAKKGLIAFTDAFEDILDNVAKNGFDSSKALIPVIRRDFGWKALNGAHRIVASLLYHPQKKIPCRTIRKYFGSFDASWPTFKNMNSHYLDAMALQYCQLKQSTHCIILFPHTQGSEPKIRKLLEESGEIVYEKKITLTHNGTINFIRLLYEGESWLGDWSNSFRGAQGKARSCFPAGSGTALVFLYDAKNKETVTAVKKQIRSLFNVGNHSAHSTDTHEQALRLAQTVFVDNSIHHINNAQLNECKRFEGLCATYKNWLKKNNYDENFFCIDSSAVLAAYGLRDCRDLDFLVHGYEISKTEPAIENHENNMKYYTVGKDDIIFNPSYHFYYNGLKFASLDTIKKMKMCRHESPKDIRDIALIESIAA